MDEIMEQLEHVMDIAISSAPKFAKIYSSLYKSLLSEWFAPDEAMAIVSNYRPLSK